MRTQYLRSGTVLGARVRLTPRASSCSAKSKASVVVRRTPSTPGRYGVSGSRAAAAAYRLRLSRNIRTNSPRSRAGGLYAGTWRYAGLYRHDLHIPQAEETWGRTRRNRPAGARDGNRRRRQAEPAGDAMAETPGPIASGAPGRGAAAEPRQAWLPSVHPSCQPGWPEAAWPGLTRLPRLVARGYLAAVPGRLYVRSTFLRPTRQPGKPPA